MKTLTLTAYRATPLACGYGPAELLTDCATSTTLPMSLGIVEAYSTKPEKA